RRLQGPVLQKLRERRPLVFFNACSTGQQGWALTGLIGWAQTWVGTGGAGAFLAPQWPVRDSLAFELARTFYLELSRGRTLGQAARLARQWARQKSRRDSTWLAFAVYGHPEARVTFGVGEEPDPAGTTAPDPPRLPEPDPQPKTSEESPD